MRASATVLASRFVAVAIASLAAAGCMGEITTGNCPGPSCPGTRSDGGLADAISTRPTDLLAIHLDPANPTVRINDSDPHPTLTFAVTGEQRDRQTRRIDAVRFQIDNSAYGAIDPVSGTLQASGLGGVATVRVFTVDGSQLSASATVTFVVSHIVNGPAVTEMDRNAFNGAPTAADADATSPQIDYPLDGAVMPRNVHAPHLMWTPRHTVADADLYRVRLTREHATIEAYFHGGPAFANDWETGAAFTSLANTDVSTPITMRVAVLSGGEVRESAPRTFKTIDGVVAGSVYYWSPPQGRLLRIDVDTATRVDFLPNPPGGCIACHAVSRDGRRLVAVTEDGRPMTGYDLTADLTASPPPSQFRQDSLTMNNGSFNGDGTRIVTSPHGGGDFHVIDATTGAVLPNGVIGNGWDPEWSPDSATIAYMRDNNLWTIPAMPGDQFGAPAQLHDAASIGGGVDWHPTFSPDSRWLVFQHGSAAFTAGTGSLYAISREGGAAVRLDHANGGTAENSFRPTFSPFNSGGYFWVLFTSSRPYGNTTAGVRDHKLIWVAAIRNRPEAGVDPSEVAYFLDGQEPTTNLSPYWAPPPCRDNGNACSSGSECCSGTCEPDSGGAPMCRPPSNACRPRGSSCGAAADCCAGLTCNAAHICDVPEPG